MSQTEVLHRPFDIDTHKQTFTHYLEVIIDEQGTIHYAVPSHQEKLISLACQKLSLTRDELSDLCPEEYYFDFMNWLCQVSGCIALWYEHRVGIPNEKQTDSINRLIEHHLYEGE